MLHITTGLFSRQGSIVSLEAGRLPKLSVPALSPLFLQVANLVEGEPIFFRDGLPDLSSESFLQKIVSVGGPPTEAGTMVKFLDREILSILIVELMGALFRTPTTPDRGRILEFECLVEGALFRTPTTPDREGMNRADMREQWGYLIATEAKDKSDSPVVSLVRSALTRLIQGLRIVTDDKGISAMVSADLVKDPNNITEREKECLGKILISVPINQDDDAPEILEEDEFFGSIEAGSVLFVKYPPARIYAHNRQVLGSTPSDLAKAFRRIGSDIPRGYFRLHIKSNFVDIPGGTILDLNGQEVDCDGNNWFLILDFVGNDTAVQWWFDVKNDPDRWDALRHQVEEVLVELIRSSDSPSIRALVPEDRRPVPSVLLKVEPLPFPLAFGPTRVDQNTAHFLRDIVRIRLPAQKWSSVPKLETLKNDRLAELTGTEEAKKEAQTKGQITINPAGRPSLNKSEVEALRKKYGRLKGFRETAETGTEYLTRIFYTKDGRTIEAGLAWRGKADPFIEEVLEEFNRKLKEAENKNQSPSLFPEINDENEKRVEALSLYIQVLRDAHGLMEIIYPQVGRQQQNPVDIPAQAIRDYLQLDLNEKNWKSRIDNALASLRLMEYKLIIKGKRDPRIESFGSFVHRHDYKAAGSGSHGQGVYRIWVNTPFLGILEAFQSEKIKLDGQTITRFNLYDRIPKETEQELNWRTRDRSKKTKIYLSLDAGSPFYAQASDLTRQQRNLLDFLQANITKIKPQRKKSKNQGPLPSSFSENGPLPPLLFGREHCPLLPEGKLFIACYGNFQKKSKDRLQGKYLHGNSQRQTLSGGVRYPGLLTEMGVEYKTTRRTIIIRDALNDMKVVVVDILGGVVVGRDEDPKVGRDRWYTLDELQEKDFASHRILKEIKFVFFLAQDWLDRLKDRFNIYQAKRHAEGKTPHAWKATDDPAEAQRALKVLQGSSPDVLVSGDIVNDKPLYSRLRAAREDRGVSQSDLGKLFQVSSMTISFWERNPEEGGRPVSRKLIDLVERWVRTGQEPTIEELGERTKNRSEKRKRGGAEARRMKREADQDSPQD